MALVTVGPRRCEHLRGTLTLVATAAALACILACGLVPVSAAAQEPVRSDRLADVAAQFTAPPADSRPMVRWWWFGPAVVKPELERELQAMQAGGFGGVEIQPVYPMELDDPARGIRNMPYLSAEFLDHVGYANRTARALGLRVDMTLASGWPYGGPHVAVTEAASRLRVDVAELPAGAASVALPAVRNGEQLIASFVGPGSATNYDATALKRTDLGAPTATAPGRGTIAASDRARVVVSYIGSRTGQQVKRAALGAEGFVLDHLSRKAIDHHLDVVATPLLKAFGDQPPTAVFSDSLEVYSTDWTDDFLQEFQRRRGYDLTPHLPVVTSGQGPDAGALRRDWVLTQTELVEERYLTPVNDWAVKHHTQFRSQTYGEPAVSLSSYRLVGLPEGEGPQFREFSFTRLATSVGHLYRRPVISAETWTWLHSPAFAATPLDMKVEADRMLLQGVNLFVGHGWPYTPPGVTEPGYSFYAAAVFNNHQPWWNVMPDVTAYLTRTSYLMRQGQPANTVAVLLPNDDAYASMTPGKVSLSEKMQHYVTPTLTTQILDAGHNLDYVDAQSVLSLGVHHPVLVLPHVTRLAPEVLAKLDAYVRQGGKIIAVGALPSMAPGYRDAARLTAQVQAASRALLANPAVTVVVHDGEVGAVLSRLITPDFKVAAHAADIGFVRRKLADADIYFIANTSNRPLRTTATLGTTRTSAAWWNPHDGKTSAATVLPAVALDLAPYESRVLILSDAPAGTATESTPSNAAPVVPVVPVAQVVPVVLAELARDWQVRYPDGATQAMPQLRSWTDDPAHRYFSGIATYTRDVTLTAAQLNQATVTLDFGQGTPLETAPKVPAGMRAMLESPVREAAEVFVNGRRAGSVWHPPYTVDVTSALRPGVNRIEVKVANLALNALAGQTLPDYRLLSARYGQRFVAQDTQLIAPQPSGLLGAVRLLAQPVK